MIKHTFSAGKAVLPARGVNGRDGVLGGIEQRFNPVEAFVGVKVVTPFVVERFHLFQISYPTCRVSIDEIGSIGRVRHVVGKVAIIATGSIHEIEVVILETAVSIPTAFSKVKARGIVQTGPWFELPANVIEEFGRDESFLAKISLVSTEDFPAVVKDVGYLLITALKVCNAILVPRRIIAKVLLGKTCSIEASLLKR